MFRGLPWARDLIHDLSNLHNVLAKEALLAHVTDWETEVKRKMTCSRSQSTSVVKPRCESRLPVLGLSLFLPQGLAILGSLAFLTALVQTSNAQNCGKRNYCFQPPVSGTLLQQPQETNTTRVKF